MRILDKYIIQRFLFPFLYCLSLFLFLYIIIDLFGHLDEILKNKAPILILQEYYLSMIPFIILHTTPVAALISTIYVISTMNKSDEITAMRAAGISVFRILLPFLYIGFILSILVFLVSETFLSTGMKNVQTIKENYIEKGGQNKDSPKKAITNIALYGKNDKLIFIKSYEAHNKTATGITILKQDNNGIVIKKLNAQKAEWTGEVWLLQDALIYKLDSQGMIRGNPTFLKELESTMESPKDLIAKGTNYEFMSFKDLANHIPNFSNSSPEITQRLRVNLHQKISLPFTTLILMLLGSGLSIRIKRRQKTSAIMGIGMSIVIGFFYYALMASSIALGKGGLIPPFFSAHIVNIIFSIIGVGLIRN